MRISRGPVTPLTEWLALKWLWWRNAYKFNLAHKPLCTRFASDVWRVGRVHLCRSCTLLYATAAATAVMLSCVALPTGSFLWTFYPVFLGVLLLSYPPLYEHFPRLVKDALRCATGCVGVMMIAFLVNGHLALGVMNLAVFLVAYRVHLHEYRKWKRRACDGCSEMGRGGVCSGFQDQVAGIRAYEADAEVRLGYGDACREPVVLQSKPAPSVAAEPIDCGVSPIGD